MPMELYFFKSQDRWKIQSIPDVCSLLGYSMPNFQFSSVIDRAKSVPVFISANPIIFRQWAQDGLLIPPNYHTFVCLERKPATVNESLCIYYPSNKGRKEEYLLG